MFNMMMNQGGMNPFASPTAGGMPQPISAAPQIPVRQAPQGGGMSIQTPAPTSGQQQPQQQGFFSSPQNLQQGINMGKSAYNGISGMFGGANPAVNPAGAPFSATMAGPPMPGLDTGASATSMGGPMAALPAVGQYEMAKNGMNAVVPGLGDAGSFSLMHLLGINI